MIQIARDFCTNCKSKYPIILQWRRIFGLNEDKFSIMLDSFEEKFDMFMHLPHSYLIDIYLLLFA